MQVLRGEASLVGIDGYNNSCYADSALFALFALHNFVDCIINPTNPPRLTPKQKSTCNILKYDIVSQLRRNGEVEWVDIQKFRQALADVLDESGYLDKFMGNLIFELPFASKQRDDVFQKLNDTLMCSLRHRGIYSRPL